MKNLQENQSDEKLTQQPPLVSVIMPVHNAAKTVRAAVRSTLRSLPRESELLIFLDGCSDNSEDLIQGFTDPRLKVIKSTQNVGVANALNELLAAARGLYIARMDADDICLPGRFRRQLSAIQRTNSDFVFANAILFGKTIRPLGLVPQTPFALDGDAVTIALIFGNPFVHPTMLSRATAIEALGGYRNLPAEDYDLWLRANANGFEILRLRSFGILYRVHESQLTRQRLWQEKNAECLEVQAGRRLLASRVLAEGVSKNTDLDDLRAEILNRLLTQDRLTKFSLAKLVGFKAAIQVIRKKGSSK